MICIPSINLRINILYFKETSVFKGAKIDVALGELSYYKDV